MRNHHDHTSRATTRQGLAPAIIGAENVDQWLEERATDEPAWGMQKTRILARQVYE